MVLDISWHWKPLVVPIGLAALYTIWMRIERKLGKSRMAITSKTPVLLGSLKKIKTMLQGKVKGLQSHHNTLEGLSRK